MSDETTTVKINQNTIYRELREVKETQIQIIEKLDHLADVPGRVRQVELDLARLAWIEKIAYTGLSAAFVSIIGLLITQLVK
jgi:hypothetical protein